MEENGKLLYKHLAKFYVISWEKKQARMLESINVATNIFALMKHAHLKKNLVAQSSRLENKVWYKKVYSLLRNNGENTMRSRKNCCSV